MADKEEKIRDNYRNSLRQLIRKGYDASKVRKLWSKVGDDYFRQESVANIIWQTSSIYDNYTPLNDSLVLIKSADTDATEGATQVFIRIMDRENLFASIVRVFDKLNLNIHGAKLYVSDGGFTLDTFYILDHNNQPIGNDEKCLEKIRLAILKKLDTDQQYSEVTSRRTPRQLKQFSIATSTTISESQHHNHSVLTVETADRVGLLAQIGQIFIDHGIKILNAKINTLGERVEDTFYITDQNDAPINGTDLEHTLQKAIRDQIDQQVEQDA